VRQSDLAVLILQDVGISSLQDARHAAAEAHRVIAERGAATARLHADEPDLLVGEKLVERADGI